MRVLTSDLWYTLVYLTPPEREALEAGRVRVWRAALEAAGLDRTRAMRAVGRLFSRGRRLEAGGRTPPIAAQAEWLSQAVRLRRPLPGKEIGTQLDRGLLRRTVKVAPGARPALRRLAAHGVALGLVSNVLFETADGTRALLDRLDLTRAFDRLYLSPEHPWAKPRPQPFRLLLREFGASPEEAAHIGDLQWDLDGAWRAGMRAILYTGLHRFEATRPRIEVPSGAPPPVRLREWKRVPRLAGA